MPIIDILGFPHFYELTPPVAQKTNPILVFIHGWLLGCNYWRPLVEELSDTYQCLIYDLRGFGDSQNQAQPSQEFDSDNYSLVSYAQDIQSLLEKLDIEQAWLIGHSLGGSIALWEAKINPQVIKGVICLNTGGGIYLEEEFERFRSLGTKLVEKRPRWLADCPLIDLLFSYIMVTRPLERRWGKQRVIDFVKADTQAALGSLLSSTTESEVHKLPIVVSGLSQPVYFIAGERDIVMETKYVRHLASFHWLFKDCGCNVIEIANCGHIAMLEQSEIVKSHIQQLLEKHIASASLS